MTCFLWAIHIHQLINKMISLSTVTLTVWIVDISIIVMTIKTRIYLIQTKTENGEFQTPIERKYWF